jgi:hypothetical protein
MACGGGDNSTTPNQEANSAPVANAGVDQNVITGSMVWLDGSGCSDANADMLTYAWTMHSTPAGSSAILSGATGVNPTFTADRDGSYVFSLVVNDGSVDSTTATVTVTAATPVTNSAPVANAGIDQNVTTGSMVRLDGSGSSDVNADMLTYAWTMHSTPAGSGAILSDATGVNPTFTADLAGLYVFSLVVNDGRVDSTTATVTVTATTPVTNSAPVANAGIDQNVITGTMVRLDGSGCSDANADMLTYAWTFQSAPAGSSAMMSAVTGINPTFTADRDGAYIFSLVVNDGRVDSAADSVTVTAVSKEPSVTIGKFGASISGTEAKWWGGVMGPDNKIYGIPFNAADILIIDPLTNTATRSTMGANISGSNKWASGCLGPDGKIYCAPFSAPDVLVIDPVAGTAVRTNFGLDLSGSVKWAGAVVGADNKIYFIPRNSTNILIIDPATGTATRSNLGADLTGSNKWSGGILAVNGKIYGVPRDALDILIIDPAAGTASRSNLGAAFTNSHKYADGILAANGKIYAIPWTNSPAILIIDPETNTASLNTMGANLSVSSGWSEAILGPQGKIYTVPYKTSDMLIIDPATGTATRSSIPGMEPSSTIKWIAGDIINNKFYGIPYESEEIILLEF